MQRNRVAGLFCGAVLGAAYAGPVAAESEPADSPKAAPAQSESHLSELFYVNADLGPQYVGLQQLHLTKDLVPSTVHATDVGPAVGVGAGVRLVFITIGPRFRYGSFRDWDLWSLDAEVGLRVPLGALEPWLLVGAGYSKLGRLQERSVRVQGYDIRLGMGVDYYFDRMFSLGGGITGDVLGMTRPGVDLNEQTGSVDADVYKLDGSSVGIALVGSVTAGFHL